MRDIRDDPTTNDIQFGRAYLLRAPSAGHRSFRDSGWSHQIEAVIVPALRMDFTWSCRYDTARRQ